MKPLYVKDHKPHERGPRIALQEFVGRWTEATSKPSWSAQREVAASVTAVQEFIRGTAPVRFCHRGPGIDAALIALLAREDASGVLDPDRSRHRS